MEALSTTVNQKTNIFVVEYVNITMLVNRSKFMNSPVGAASLYGFMDMFTNSRYDERSKATSRAMNPCTQRHKSGASGQFLINALRMERL